MMLPRSWRAARTAFAAIAAFVPAAATTACAPPTPKVATLSLSSGDSLRPAPGQTVTLAIRAVMDDGTSMDVTSSATCRVVAPDPPGTLAGNVFTATKWGVADIECAFAGATGSLGITVPAPLKVKVETIQQGALAPSAEVLVDVVVFGLEPDGTYTNFWGQDASGGPYSGVLFRDARKAVADAGPSQAAAAEGDLVTVHGTYAERDGHSVVNFDTVTKTGTGTPTATVVPVAQLDPAMWDGCLVTVQNVVVTNPAFDPYTFQVADAADPSATLLIETLLYAAKPTASQRFGAITGPLYVLKPKSGGPLEVAIAPRREGDLAP